ncbi:MAG TPA: MoaD/ThiS family protein [Gammaproteobacteria bacterium]|nr:MoaD/ThiS family protein [Gammaproteobacteria bacterium]
MSCVVRIPSPLRSYTRGASQVAASGSTLEDVLADLERQFPGMRIRMVDEQDRIRRHVRVFVNRRAANGLSEPVQSGDDVQVICALSGG